MEAPHVLEQHAPERHAPERQVREEHAPERQPSPQPAAERQPASQPAAERQPPSQHPPERQALIRHALERPALERAVPGQPAPGQSQLAPERDAPEQPVLNQREFRDILGRFATGVVLVTAQTPGGPAGMAVNSFTSVSLDPPLVALCAAHTSTTWPAIRATGSFAVTILGDQHRELCRLFSEHGADRFAGHDWVRSPSGHPLPADGVAWLECRLSAIHPAGDHELVIASAGEGAVTDTANPLVFHAGRFRGLAA